MYIRSFQEKKKKTCPSMSEVTVQVMRRAADSEGVVGCPQVGSLPREPQLCPW